MASRVKKILLILSVIIVITVGAGVVYRQATAERLVESVTIEAGSNLPTVSEYLLDPEAQASYITEMSSLDPNQPGTYSIEVKVGKKVYTSTLHIIDTTEPMAEVISYEIWPEEVKAVDDFVTNIQDVTEVKVSLKETIDYTKVGDQLVTIILEDTSGNTSELTTTLTIKADTEPPTISGVQDQNVFIGDKVSYKRDITVRDNRDEDIELIIDSSAVNLKQAGTYEVIYTATDDAGNTASVTSVITVEEKPLNYINPEELNKLADQVLAKIVKDDMTDLEKLWAIYKWTRTHINYTGSSDKSDWMLAAVQGIKKATGDCFNYYATSKILLTRAGFENVMVQRVGGKTLHFWNLVKYEDQWYHFDTTPHRRGFPFVGFMRTDAELAEYTKLVDKYYHFDPTTVPATPTEALEIPFATKL